MCTVNDSPTARSNGTGTSTRSGGSRASPRPGRAVRGTWICTHAPAGTFSFGIVFCGYAPTTHLGILDMIDAAAPIATPTLFFIGQQDTTISPALSEDAATRFSDATLLYGPGGHNPPSGGQALDDVVAYMEGYR